ncbi:MAG: hypothetical protein C5S49_03765 [Candidatus Methanogaster sp.]|nr:MAG: hypothetical protein C5S49_03765 [ANME-2 cluster archaeon]
MDKLPRWLGRKIIRTFKKAGWGMDRIEGSHHILVKGVEWTLVVLVNKNKPIKVGLLKGLMEDAGLANYKFLRLCYEMRRI